MKFKNLVKKSAAASVSLCMLGSAMSFNAIIPDVCSVVAHAADAEKPEEKSYSFNKETGELTFKGNIELLAIIQDSSLDPEKVKSITAENGTVFPYEFEHLIALFTNCETLDLRNADFHNITKLSSAFTASKKATSINLSGCDLSSVQNMSHAFSGLDNLISVDMSGCDLSNVTDMSIMFSSCPELTKVDLSNCSMDSIKNMSNMFGNCPKLSSVDFSGTEIEGVEKINTMFSQCESIKSIDLSSIKTTIDTDNFGLFFKCSSLESIDLSNMVISRYTPQFIQFCDNIKEIKLGEGATEITDNAFLKNGGGWVNVKDKTKVISGNDIYAVFKNEGANTYIRLDSDEKTDTLYGDANCDGIVDLSDAVIIMQTQSNPAKFGENGSDPTHMTAQGIINGDVSGNGDGITSKDALTIQKYLLGLLLELPE